MKTTFKFLLFNCACIYCITIKEVDPTWRDASVVCRILNVGLSFDLPRAYISPGGSWACWAYADGIHGLALFGCGFALHYFWKYTLFLKKRDYCSSPTIKHSHTQNFVAQFGWPIHTWNLVLLTFFIRAEAFFTYSVDVSLITPWFWFKRFTLLAYFAIQISKYLKYIPHFFTASIYFTKANIFIFNVPDNMIKISIFPLILATLQIPSPLCSILVEIVGFA